MINLIPPKAKKSLVIEYWVRVASVWFILWSVVILVAASILFPAYVLISSQVDVYATSAAEASEKVASFEDVSVSLVQASQEARAIMNESEIEQFSDYIDLFSNLERESIYISEISLQRTEAGISPVTLSGIASDRQSLASFRDRLLAEPVVESVELPISNLAQGSDISFSLIVVISETESI